MAKSTRLIIKGQTTDSKKPSTGLAAKVVDVLNERVQENKPILRLNVLQQLEENVLSPAPMDPPDLVDLMRGLRISEEDLLNHYIPAAARRMGEAWENDELNFAQVTIGCARLQSVLHYLSDCWVDGGLHSRADRAPQDIGFMLATLQGDEHSLGMVTIAAKLRRRGHVVQLLLGTTDAEIRQQLKKHEPDCLLLSASSVASLDLLAHLCTEAKKINKTPPVIAVGGLVLDLHNRVLAHTGADLATNDLQSVIHLCLSRRIGQISVVRS